MKTKQGFVLREVGGTTMVLATGEACVAFNGMITLNGTGKLLWQRLEAGAEMQDLVGALCAEYDVDAATATRDVTSFLDTMRKNDLLNG